MLKSTIIHNDPLSANIIELNRPKDNQAKPKPKQVKNTEPMGRVLHVAHNIISFPILIKDNNR